MSSQSRDSTQDNFGTISGLQLGSPGKKSHLDVVGMEIIEQKAPKNVEGLSPVGETTRVVTMEV